MPTAHTHDNTATTRAAALAVDRANDRVYAAISAVHDLLDGLPAAATPSARADVTVALAQLRCAARTLNGVADNIDAAAVGR